MEDHEIVQLYWQRDERAIGESEKKYGGICRSVALRVLENIEDSEECVSDTWLRSWNAMPPQRPNLLGAFLARITRNLALDRWRADQGLPPIEAADRDRWKEAYLRHGPFRRKLDRIRGGLAYLVLILTVCIPCAAIAVTALAVVIGSHTTGSLVAAVIVILMLSLFIFLPVRYLRAVSRMDKKTLDWYFRPAVIRADPLEDAHKQDHDKE